MTKPKTARAMQNLSGWQSRATLYVLSRPVKYEHWDDKTNERVSRTTKYVIVSAVVAMFSGPETYIFPADKYGNVLSWSELDGSLRGTLDHSVALARAGYIEVQV